MLYNAVVGQSGGPTSAINATLRGVIDGAFRYRDEGRLGTLYGMKNGIEGFLREDLVDLLHVFRNKDDLDTLELTPAAALGSCRRKLKSYDEDAETYVKILEILKKYNIRYFFYIGGNDSMDTVLKLSEYAKACEYELYVIGVPKTVDNDLCHTDHTPGFGSAAKYIATTIKEIKRDVSVYKIPAVTIVEIMGRDAGWLTAAASLPSLSGDAPDLIYLPERAFSMDLFLDDVKAALANHPDVLVAVSEGIRSADGEYIGASATAVDAFGHKQLSGAGRVLEAFLKAEIGCKVRSIELNLPQRCAAHLASLTDIRESARIGSAAFDSAIACESGVMMTFVRKNNPYSVEIFSVSIKDVANEVRSVPDAYINDKGNGITEEGIDYLRPLILGEPAPIYVDGMPKHIKI